LFFVEYSKGVSWSKLQAKSVGCDPDASNLVACLRALDASKVAFVHKLLYNETGYFLPLLYPVMPWGPVIDGSNVGLLDVPLKLLNSNKGNYVPFIGGTNNNEGSIFIPPIHAVVPAVTLPLTEDEVVILLEHFFCSNETIINTILPLYPVANYPDADHQAAMLLRDWFFVCPTRRISRAFYNVNPKLPWVYHFLYNLHDPTYNIFGDYHSSELNFVWANDWPFDARTWNETDHQMSNTFGAYWSNLNWDNSANGHESTPITWPNYDSTKDEILLLDVPASVQANYQSQECAMWDQVVQLCAYCNC